MEENVVFARVGWMQSYQSTVTGEPGPIGGGKYNLKNLGWERDNFLIDADGCAHGYFAIGSGTQAINLFRVGGMPQTDAIQKLSGILVVFVAPHPIREDLDGPVVVGWYRNATLYREEQESADGTRAFRVEAAFADVYCIPSAERDISIPRAKPGVPGIGQSNIYYTREPDGRKREFVWIKRVLDSIAEFEADSVVTPIVSAEVQAERKAGFQSDPRIRKAVEDRAMQVVRLYFNRFSLKNTSKTHSYDYSYLDDQTERYVEVKGSQQEDPSIILTRNEVAFARQHSAYMELCVVHSIVVKDGPDPIATGGVLEHFPQWNPDMHELAAIHYECKLNRTLAAQRGR
jgi:hypothetical protein